eukprot:3928261-Alexandrium_andersonii.AAC.1
MEALFRHYQQHFLACCERVTIASVQLAFAPEIQGIADELAATHNPLDWGARAPADTGWWSLPDSTRFRSALGECRGKAPGPDAWRAEEILGLPEDAIDELLALLAA